jgi:MerR family mercuric resistance operon transcriptional regulator
MTLTVGRLARAAGVGVETIRFYEKRGLIAQPQRPKSGYRRYEQNDVARIHFIKRAQSIGFTLKEIGELIQLEQDSQSQCGDVQERAQDKIRAIDEKLADLTRMRGELDRLATHCISTQSLADCGLINCLGTQQDCCQTNTMREKSG